MVFSYASARVVVPNLTQNTENCVHFWVLFFLLLHIQTSNLGILVWPTSVPPWF